MRVVACSLIAANLLAGLVSCTHGVREPGCFPAFGCRDTIPAGENWDYQYGAYSPNGMHLFFVGMQALGKGGQIGEIRSGQPFAITPKSIDVFDFDWMPDSQSILVSYHATPTDPLNPPRTDNFGIFDLNGHLIHEIPVDTPGSFQGGLNVRKDGLKALVTMESPGTGLRTARLGELDLRTGVLKEFPTELNGSDSWPRYASVDKIVFEGIHLNIGEDRSYVAVMDLRTGKRKILSPTDQIAELPTVSSDGKTIVYDGYAQSSSSGGRVLWESTVESMKPRQVIALNARYASFLPDGRHLLVLEIGGFGQGGSLHITRPLAL